jgi:Replication protein
MSQRICRLRRIAPEVQLVEHIGPHGRRLSYGGLSTCKSPLCPLCAPKWARTRSEEITSAIDFWSARKVVFATLTMAHRPGMSLALQHRLLTRAFGNLWSGRAGQSFAESWGGKPESIRAHDRTWSREYGWHPHLHVLFFRRSLAQSETELRETLSDRWPEALATALRSMKRFCRRTLARAATDLVAPCVKNASAGRCHCLECTTLRARRMFGSKLVPRREPLIDAVHRLSDLLRDFSEQAIRPSRAIGVDLQAVRAEDRASTYLSKLGLELSFSEAKDVHERVDSRGRVIRHYPHWGVAHLACQHGNPLRVEARRAWGDLFRSTKATQTITFSDRTALGLGADPYADGDEPPEPNPEEFTRLLGSIVGGTWDAMKKTQQHGLLVTLGEAHEMGILGELPYVKPPPGWHGIPSSRGPPVPRYVQPEGIMWAIALAKAETRGKEAVRAPWFARTESFPGGLFGNLPPCWQWQPIATHEPGAPWDLEELMHRREVKVKLQLGLRFGQW